MPKRSDLKPIQLFNLAFGVAVGVGWIVVLGGWLRDAGPLGAILAFAVAAVFMLAIGRAYGLLAIEYPVAGGEFAYARAVFGLRTGYWVGWFLALAYISVIAFEMVSLAWIVRVLFPGVLPAADALGPFDLGGTAVGIVALACVVLIGTSGSKGSARAQDFMVAAKVLLSVFLIVGGLLGGTAANLEPLWGTHPGGSLAGFLAVFSTAPFFFAGFGAVAQAVGEVRSPESIRRMPWVMGAVIVGTGLFYVLIILSAAAALDRPALLAAPLPAVAAYAHAFASPLVGRLVLLLGFLGVLTILNGVFFACARLVAALADDGLAPALFGRRNRRGAPIVAGLFVALTATLLATAGQAAIPPFLNVASASISGVMGVTCVVLMVMIRRRGGRGMASATVGALLAGAMVVVPLWQAAATNGFSFEWAAVLGWAALGVVLRLLARSGPKSIDTPGS